MKTTFLNRLLFVAVIASFSFTSCIEPVEETKVDYYKKMTDYMKANNLDLNNMTTQWTIDAKDVAAAPANFFVIDLRSAADFAAGRIQGAVNSTLPNILETAKNAGSKQIVVACYTGQTAALGHVALRLSGYPTSKILKWGMSSWNTTLDRWTPNISDRALTHANWSATNTIVPSVNFALPTFEAVDTTGAGILKERVAVMLAKGYGAMSVSANDVLTTPANYFINNYWTAQNVTDHGHIKGAYRINEDLTLAADGFKKLNPSQTIVTYCWTGQTSALVSAYLTVLGYENAKSIGFGANALVNSTLKANKWAATNSGSYPLSTN
ncbi:MAG: rhodanese-like domain-containing protein [Paludibacter sp.]|nr:rhodanese-like domain-containing protein [Paludibacter sp.]